MARPLITAIALLVALQAVPAAQAQYEFQVDGHRIQVPPNLSGQWEEVDEKDRWITQQGNRFAGDFERFACRQYEVIPGDDEAGTPTRVVITWFKGGECQRLRRDIYSIDDDRRRVLSRLLGERLREITQRRVLQVVFAEFTNCRPLPPPPSEGEEETIEEEPLEPPVGSEGESERENVRETEAEREVPPVRRRHRIPVSLLGGKGRGLLFPFAQMAQTSFQRRLANADCSRISGEKEEGEEEGEERERQGGPERERENENEEEPEQEREREREREEQEEEPEGEEEEEQERERKGRTRFGFVVVRFVAEAGSLAFQRDGRPSLICVEAESPRQAIHKVRHMKAFQNVTGPVSVERVSHVIAPHPPACHVRRPPKRGGGKGEEEEQEEPLEPRPDPLNVEAEELEEGIPLLNF